MEATLNCDCGESYGPYIIGEDEELLKIVDLANLACGVHAGDPNVMNSTVIRAGASVKIGAHPGLPDREGFGRRELKMDPESFFLCLLTQVGALDAILKLHNLRFNHLKPHGQAYVMSSKDILLARGSARIAKLYGLPLLGLAGSAHQAACEELGVAFIPEWYADLTYNDEGGLIPPRPGSHPARKAPEHVYAETRKMLETLTWKSVNGTILKFPSDQQQVSICVHSDVPGAVETAQAVRRAIDDVKRERI